MKDCILSIVVPSYKTKNYLDISLPPFISNELLGKIIVFLIDDGSPDDTAKYLKDYEKMSNYF